MQSMSDMSALPVVCLSTADNTAGSANSGYSRGISSAAVCAWNTLGDMRITASTSIPKSAKTASCCSFVYSFVMSCKSAEILTFSSSSGKYTAAMRAASPSVEST